MTHPANKSARMPPLIGLYEHLGSKQMNPNSDQLKHLEEAFASFTMG
jgi:hypothetical protein